MAAITPLTKENFQKFLTKPVITAADGTTKEALGAVIAVDCSDCKGPNINSSNPPLKGTLETVANDVDYKDFAFGYIDCADAAHADFCSNTFMQYPTVGILLKGDQAPTTMPGSITAERMDKFIDSHGHLSLYDPAVQTNVTVVENADDFKAKVLDAAAANKSVLVEFYADWCPHCQHLVDDFDKAAGELKTTSTVAGNVEVVAVNCADDNNGLEKLCQDYGIQGYPTLKLFAPGFKAGDKPADFSHKSRPTVENLKTFVESGGANSGAAPAPEPTEVENFEYANIDQPATADEFSSLVLNADGDVLVEFYADWCYHCKQYKDTFDKLAAEMKAKYANLKVVAVNCNDPAMADVCGPNGQAIAGFPTFKLFSGPAGAKEAHVNERGHPQTVDEWDPFLSSHGADNGHKEALEFRIQKLTEALEDLPEQLQTKLAGLDEAKSALEENSEKLRGELQAELEKVQKEFADQYGSDQDADPLLSGGDDSSLGADGGDSGFNRYESATDDDLVACGCSKADETAAVEDAAANDEVVACGCGKADEDEYAYIEDSNELFDMTAEEQAAFAALVEDDGAC